MNSRERKQFMDVLFKVRVLEKVVCKLTNKKSVTKKDMDRFRKKAARELDEIFPEWEIKVDD